MEDLIQLLVNNGLGVASFFCLIYFMLNFVNKINDTNQQICKTLESIEKTLSDLSKRVDKIENKNNKKIDKF